MELTATKRTELGRATKALRKKGFIPAELYGHGTKNVHLSVAEKDFKRVLRQAGETTLIDLMVDGTKHPVMIHEVAVHPVSDIFMNIDFYQVRLDEEIEIKVPIEFIGESAAVKEKGGVLIKSMAELRVKALPADIPKEIKVSLGPLAEIGASIHLKEIALPKGVKFLDNPETVVATVIAKMTEEEEAKLVAEAQVDVAEVKSEAEEKAAERAEEKAAAVPEGEAAKPVEAVPPIPEKAPKTEKK